jgi:hypothetical protein
MLECTGVLGTGFKLITLEGAQKEPFLLTVPLELNRDHEEIMNVAQNYGFVTSSIMAGGW